MSNKILFDDPYCKGLTPRQIIELAKKSFRFSKDNCDLMNKVEQLEREVSVLLEELAEKKSIWHSTEEIPERNRHFLLIGAVAQVFNFSDDSTVEEWHQVNGIRRATKWAYVDDLEKLQ
ncbi:MAG: hypothetical protein PHI35_07725 [Victivallaceae bacterium]|nr:hypothetical protein [Victivallaceae bacterium]